MSLRIYTLLKKAFYKLGLISDYVVDYGTSDIWTYRKWQSGIAECWGRRAWTAPASWTVWDTDYYCIVRLLISPLLLNLCLQFLLCPKA